jgi:hypothetical protein
VEPKGDMAFGELIDPILRDLKPLAHKGLGADLRD